MKRKYKGEDDIAEELRKDRGRFPAEKKVDKNNKKKKDDKKYPEYMK